MTDLINTTKQLLNASQLFNDTLTAEEKSVVGGEQAGMMRTMADFAKAAYHLEPSENKVINDISPNADAAATALIIQGWVGVNLQPILSATSIVAGQTITNGMFDDGFYINGNAAACVERCGDAIVLSFRGTNDNGKDGVNNPYDPNNTIHTDKDQWSNMASHYALLQPLITAFDAYVAANGISKVYVTGHSMGGAMALEYMSSHLGSQYQAVTFGAPPFTQLNSLSITARKDYSLDNRITQIEIAKDPVPMAFDIQNLVGNTNARPAGHIIDFGGNQTLDTPNLEPVPYLPDYYGRDANHSMDYYRQITDSVDADSWTKILAGTGTQTVLLGGQQITGTSDFIVDGQLSGTNTSVGNGNDQLVSLDFKAIYGGKGDDILVAGTNPTLLLGGIGTDTAVYGAWATYTVTGTAISATVTALTGTGGTDTLSSIENLIFNGVTVTTAAAVNDAPVGVFDNNTSDAIIEAGAGVVGDSIAVGNVLNNDTDADSTLGLGETKTVKTVGNLTTNPNAVAGIYGGLLLLANSGYSYTLSHVANVGNTVVGVYGSLLLLANGDYTYTLNNTNAATDALSTGQIVTDNFTYTVVDAHGAVSAPTTLAISIAGSDDTLIANNPLTLTTPATLNYTDTAFIDSFATKTGVLVGSDIDVGATLSYGITGGVDNLNGTVSKSTAYGTLTITTATGAYSFVPLASAIEPLGANVTDSTLTIMVSDGTLSANKLFTVAIAQSGTTETIGNDVLMGGVGANSWAGLAGDDTYYVDVAGDSITEAVNAGADRVYSTSADYTLADNIETLVIWGAGVNGSGNGGINYLFGNALNNTLDGKGGADGMMGGAGNDTYFVDNIGDTVTENSNQGFFDAVNSSVNYTLTSNVEVLTLTGAVGTEALNGNGNNDNNYLFGNAGNNVLDGKAGADVMVGKAGDDTYYVDNANDVIIENANEGTDSVISSVSYGLSALNPANPTLVAGANAENLTITGTALYAFGNDLNNTITGNSNNNVIGGGAGLDTLIGGAGDDVYYVDVAGDAVVEKAGEGFDIVYSTATDYTLADNSEVLVVWGAGLNGTGNAQDNYVFGNTYGGGAVNNSLSGGAGNDILMGFDGADTYNGGTGQDTYNLTEQVAATDSIQIAAGDSLATVGLFDKAIGFTLGTNISSNAGVDKLDLVNTAITANTASQNGTDVGAIQTNSITNGILSFQGAGGLTIAANALNLSDALTYLQANITDGSTVAFTAASDTYVFQDGGLGVNDTVVDLVGVMANSMNNTGFGAGAVWLI